MTDSQATWRRILDWLREHKLLQVLAIYAGASWAILEVTDVFIDKLGLPGWFFPAAVLLLLIGLALVVATSLVEYGVPASGVERPATRPKEVLADRLSWLTWPRAILGAVLAFGALGTAGVWMAKRSGDEPLMLEPAANAVAVLPFRVTGPDLDLWREGLMDVLSANLDGVAGLRAVDTRTVLSRWRSRVGAEDASLDTALAVAREAGARWAVLGQAVELSGQVHLDTRLYAIDAPEPVASTTVVGAPDSIMPLLEGVTLRLLRELGGEQGLGVGGRAFTSTSIEAVKAFLEGEQRMRRSEWAAAAEHFERALASDSTFAMAAARLSDAYGWQYGAGASAAAAAAARALRLADRLPPRDRGLVELKHLKEEGRLEAIDLARRLTTRYPDDPEVWYELGEAYFHLGNAAGIPEDERTAPFERAIALDSSFTVAWIHPIESAGRANQLERFDSLADLYLARDSTGDWARSLRTTRALLDASGPDSAVAIERLAGLSTRAMWSVSMILMESTRPEALELAVYEMAAPHRSSDERTVALLLWVNMTEVWRGRYAAAQAAVDRARDLAPESPIVPAFQLANIVHGAGDPALATRGIERGRRMGLSGEPGWHWLLGTRELKYGEEARALASADTLDLLADSLRAASDSLGALRAHGLALGLRGLAAERRGDHRRAVELLRTAIPAIGYRSGAFISVGEQLMGLANALLEMGEEAEALRILDSGFHLDFYYDAPAALARAQIYERRGERDRAIRAYSRVVTLWSDCDPELRPQRELAERALSRLVGAG